MITMIAVSFWGVGSIINDFEVRQDIKKGEMMGRFGYGGSSILMVFVPGAVEFTVDGIGEECKEVKPGMGIGRVD